MRRHHPELDEVVEVAEAVQLGERVDVVRGSVDPVAIRDLEQRRGRTAPSRCTCSSIFGSVRVLLRAWRAPPRASKAMMAFAANRGLQALPVWSARDPTMITPPRTDAEWNRSAVQWRDQTVATARRTRVRSGDDRHHGNDGSDERDEPDPRLRFVGDDVCERPTASATVAPDRRAAVVRNAAVGCRRVTTNISGTNVSGRRR